MVQTHIRGYRGTRLHPYGVYCATLSLSFLFIISYLIYPITFISHIPYPTPTVLFLFPVPLPFPILLFRLPFSGEYQSLLLPPLLGNPQSWTPLCLQTEVQNRLRHNVLCEHILPPGDVGLHILQPYLLHIFPQWGLLPGPILRLPVFFLIYNVPTCGGNYTAAARCEGL